MPVISIHERERTQIPWRMAGGLGLVTSPSGLKISHRLVVGAAVLAIQSGWASWAKSGVRHWFLI